MSTKVYEGYRFQAAHTNEFLLLVKAKTHQILAKYLRPMEELRTAYRNVMQKLNANPPVDLGLLREMTRENGWVMRLHHDWMYVYPYGTFAGTMVLRPLRRAILKTGYVEEFRYWNNVDRDRTVSKEKWAYRGLVWDLVLDLQPMYVTTFELWDVSAVEVEHLQDAHRR